MRLAWHKCDIFALGFEAMTDRQNCGAYWVGFHIGWRFYGVEWDAKPERNDEIVVKCEHAHRYSTDLVVCPECGERL